MGGGGKSESLTDIVYGCPLHEWRKRDRDGEREGEGGMFHFRLMICTAHGPDHEEEEEEEEEEDQPSAGLLERGSGRRPESRCT